MMLEPQRLTELSPLEAALARFYRMDEGECIQHLQQNLQWNKETELNILSRARRLVEHLRSGSLSFGMETLLQQFSLASEEGIALMCLAEALLRIPDKETIDDLIRDKITSATWEHSGDQSSLWGNAAQWGLMITGKVLQFSQPTAEPNRLSNVFRGLVERSGEPLIRQAVKQAIKLLGNQFVMAESMQDALTEARKQEAKGFRYSYDRLGEAALTEDDAQRYFEAYTQAMQILGEHYQPEHFWNAPSISIKLSALHPRYELAQKERVFAELLPRLHQLVRQAKALNLGLTLDAEESDRLELSLQLFEALCATPEYAGWDGLGLAVQAYQKRAIVVIDQLIEWSQRYQRRIPIRLVKGAYWDSEIKRAQELGLSDYPVFTRKAHTDLSYLTCAQKILAHPTCFYAQFATHNAFTVATILEWAGPRSDFEFQCLHGMGQRLYTHITEHQHIPCRIYAPIGAYHDLLPYLVRRLLENGANSSFVHQIVDRHTPIDELIQSPLARMGSPATPHPKIPKPTHLYGSARRNSAGVDWSHYPTRAQWQQSLEEAVQHQWVSLPLLAQGDRLDKQQPLYSPSDRTHLIGHWVEAESEDCTAAIDSAQRYFTTWSRTAVSERADCLKRAADLMEQQAPTLMAMLMREAGKNHSDAVAEIREAVDFCRYYAQEGLRLLSHPTVLPGPTGEHNQLTLHGRGVITCISPWNFPLAIFVGQITAALMAGNCVIAKPALQTTLIGTQAVRLLHQAGIPRAALQYLPGRSRVIGDALTQDPRIQGVIFTGSTDTAQHINQVLAKRPGPIVPLIAETGGLNAMIVDSSALPEQVVQCALISAFGSAGQRCSALRILFLQEDIADRTLALLRGAMDEWRVGDPTQWSTDLGPVIDESSRQSLEQYVAECGASHTIHHRMAIDPALSERGNFFAPTLIELSHAGALEREIFGPVLHVVRYRASELDQVLAAIHQTGYGLTLGIHSRIQERIDSIVEASAIGNTYVNRSMIGAVVGVQPFGGEGLSGTGPKAGGPHYLLRLCTERTLTVNTTAAGGNTRLLLLDE